MTDQELKDLVAQLAISQAETGRLLQETDRALRESGEEADRRIRETDRQLQETTRALRESDEETDRQLRENAQLIKELGKQIGGLGDKFGSFTEGLALPSMTQILEEHFGLDNIAPRYKVRKNGRTLELDVFGFSNTEKNVAVVIEVKSHLREEGVEQLFRILGQFPEFLPQHRDKKLYGLIAAVDIPEELREKVLKEGIFLAQIAGDTFTLQVPDDFVPRSFQEPVPKT